MTPKLLENKLLEFFGEPNLTYQITVDPKANKMFFQEFGNKVVA